MAGPSVTQTIEVPTPLDERDAGSSLVQIGADLVWNNRPGGRLIYRSNLDGTPTEAPWLDIQPEITAFSFLGAQRIYNLDVDPVGRLYVWIVGNTTELNILRYGPDGLFDRRFRLLPNLNGASPASHDATPSISSRADIAWPDAIGMQINGDGTLAYVTMDRALGAGDTSLQKQSIYKFDLEAADAGTYIAPATVFAQIDAHQDVSNPSGDTLFDIADIDELATYVGLAVDPVDGKVAAQVVTHTNRVITGAFDPVTTDDAHYYLYVYDADGTLASTTLIADSVLNLGLSGVPQSSTTYRFTVRTGPIRNMTWSPDGSEVYYWINLDDGSQAQDVPPFQRTWLCDSGGKMGSHLISSDPDTQPRPFGYALSFAAPVAGCTDGAHNGDIYAYLGKTLSDARGDKVYRYDQEGDLKEIIPVTYTHDGSYLSSKAEVAIVRLFDGDLYLMGRKTPVSGYTGSFPHLHPTILKISGTAPHATTVLFDLDGNADSDRDILGFTHDSSGNIYLTVEGANGSDPTTASTRGLFLYKLNSAGAVQWRRQLDAGYDLDDAAIPWLADDDSTLLYATYTGVSGTLWETIRRYDVATNTQKSDWFKLKDADGSPPNYQQEDAGGRSVLLPNNKMLVGIWRSIGTAGTEGADVIYEGPSRQFYNSARTSGGLFLDDSMCLDLDPDGVSVWSHSGYAANLYRFNIATRSLTKTIHLSDESANTEEHVPFALCGGPGGHGNPPPVVGTAVRRRGGQPAFLY